jgi:hypothetical protein
VLTLVLQDVLGIWLVEVLHGVGVGVHLVVILLIIIILVFLRVVTFILFLHFTVLKKNELVVEERKETAWVERPPGGVYKVVDSVPGMPLAVDLSFTR